MGVSVDESRILRLECLINKRLRVLRIEITK